MGENQKNEFKNQTPEQTIKTLNSNPEKGLDQEEVNKRLTEYGENKIEEKKTNPILRLLLNFWGPIPWMIEIAAFFSVIIKHWDDFGIIMLMLFVNAGVRFWEEYKAGNAIEALKKRLAPTALVLRDGKWNTIDAKELVPGDIIQLQMGKIVPADLKLLDGKQISVDESALTGESLPVDKKTGDIAYSSTIVKSGEMKAIVIATGKNTNFAKTTELVQGAKAQSHFQKMVMKIGNFLIIITAILVVIILIVSWIRGTSLIETILFVLVLTIAAIPVALPAVLSVTMAVGAWRLAKMEAIVTKLESIEEMAGIDILCADKTGTLTTNELNLADSVLISGTNAEEVILAGALASHQTGEDPIDNAVMTGIKDKKILDEYKIINFEPFDPTTKKSFAEVEHNGEKFKVTKGASQVILDIVKPSEDIQNKVKDEVDKLASKGYRALGVAKTDPQGNWIFLGILPIYNPPRADTAQTLRDAMAKGLQIKMVTGDHLAIAKEIASMVGLGQNILPANKVFLKDEIDKPTEKLIESADGFAQVLPENKFTIVKVLQSLGHIVGMTGDGVNDAPALKQADAGIAVSKSTDAARAAADLVLTAPGLSVIITAIEEARKIFERMTSYATYRIAETIRVLLFVSLSILILNFFPVTPIMIVLLSLLNDIPIMTIAYDNTIISPTPVRWDMRRVLGIASSLGVMGVIETFILLLIAKFWLHLSADVLRTFIFLKLLVAGHLTIYITRTIGNFWNKPYPSWLLIGAAETTQLFGTLIAVYGVFVAPIGWGLALFVWAYALIWFVIENYVKRLAYYFFVTKHHSKNLNI